MKMFLATAILFGSFSAQAQVCTSQEILKDAQKASEQAVSGKEVALSPCLQKLPSVKKVVPKVAIPQAPPVPPSKEDNQNSSSAVVSPIIIVTGSPQTPQAPTYQPQVVEVKKCEPEIRYREKVITKKVKQRRNMNTIMLMGGVGPMKVETTIDANEALVQTHLGAIYGVQYLRHFESDWVVGASVLSNSTATLNIGVDF